jgi:hypothetical protein
VQVVDAAITESMFNMLEGCVPGIFGRRGHLTRPYTFVA